MSDRAGDAGAAGPGGDAGPGGLVLGIDVGSKNLAVCAILPGADAHGTGDVIELWALATTTPSPRALAAAMACVDGVLPRVAHVVIERQPGTNPKAARLQSMLEMYFALRGDAAVHVQHAKRKLDYAATTPYYGDSSTATYYARKKAAVTSVAAFLGRVPQPDAARAVWAGSKKRDDLADALLHAMAHAHWPPAAARKT